ncbi:hypothetical protein QE418_003011 [Microbacterium testaceum]|nr:hypothetical protein [Microbacterium testaceum]
MQITAAELFGGDVFADRGLDQGRSAQEHRALAAHDDALVAHRGDVGAARGARAHDGGDLRDAEGRQLRLIAEDAPEVIAVGEHLVLHRQEGPTGVDEVDAGQAVLARDLLRAQVLLHREREVGSALHGRVVREHHDVAPVHEPDPRDDAGSGRLAVVEAVGRERGDLEKGAALVEEPVDTLAREEFAAARVPFARGVRAAAGCAGQDRAELFDEAALGRRGCGGVDDRCCAHGGSVSVPHRRRHRRSRRGRSRGVGFQLMLAN